VRLVKSGMQLDFGAIAKGFATQVVADLLEESGVDNILISAGGNVKAIGKPGDERAKWGVGIKDPSSTLNYSTSEENLLDVAFVSSLSVVTSGSYERFYVVDGFSYHHIIDESTLIPAAHYQSVTVIT
ncbi:MAG: FAD:protein FMN transferase, partial [Victivallales bacterium]|nr:FAD:protein FMN transferase [Victivallales bacterium]